MNIPVAVGNLVLSIRRYLYCHNADMAHSMHPRGQHPQSMVLQQAAHAIDRKICQVFP
jgi:hypothetical protein